MSYGFVFCMLGTLCAVYDVQCVYVVCAYQLFKKR